MFGRASEEVSFEFCGSGACAYWFMPLTFGLDGLYANYGFLHWDFICFCLLVE